MYHLKSCGYHLKSTVVGFSLFLSFSILSSGDQVANEIKTIHVMGQPITSLILSNSRIEGLTVNSFQLIEDSLQELRMDNCSVNLDAIVNLSNLRVSIVPCLIYYYTGHSERKACFDLLPKSSTPLCCITNTPIPHALVWHYLSACRFGCLLRAMKYVITFKVPSHSHLQTDNWDLQ